MFSRGLQAAEVCQPHQLWENWEYQQPKRLHPANSHLRAYYSDTKSVSWELQGHTWDCTVYFGIHPYKNSLRRSMEEIRKQRIYSQFLLTWKYITGHLDGGGISWLISSSSTGKPKCATYIQRLETRVLIHLVHRKSLTTNTDVWHEHTLKPWIRMHYQLRLGTNNKGLVHWHKWIINAVNVNHQTTQVLESYLGIQAQRCVSWELVYWVCGSSASTGQIRDARSRNRQWKSTILQILCTFTYKWRL